MAFVSSAVRLVSAGADRSCLQFHIAPAICGAIFGSSSTGADETRYVRASSAPADAAVCPIVGAAACVVGGVERDAMEIFCLQESA